MLRRSVSASVRPLSACAPSTVSQVIGVDVERRKGGVEAQCLRQRPLIMTWETVSSPSYNALHPSLPHTCLGVMVVLTPLLILPVVDAEG